MIANHYRLNDILCEIDRNKTTIIRWEDQGLIPKAPKDSRGWRYYTKEQIDHIIKLVKKTNYFQNSGRQKNVLKRQNYSIVAGVANMKKNKYVKKI